MERPDVIQVTVIQTGTEDKHIPLRITSASMPDRRGIGHRVLERNMQRTLEKLHRRHGNFHTLRIDVDGDGDPQPLHLRLDRRLLCRSRVARVRLTTGAPRMLADDATICGVPIWKWNSAAPNRHSQCRCPGGHELEIRGFVPPPRRSRHTHTRRREPRTAAVPPAYHATDMHTAFQAAEEWFTDAPPHWGSSESLHDVPDGIPPAVPDASILEHPRLAPPLDVPYDEQPNFGTGAHRGSTSGGYEWDESTQPSLYGEFPYSSHATQLGGSTLVGAATPPVSPRPVLSSLFAWGWSSTAPTVVSADDADTEAGTLGSRVRRMMLPFDG